MPDGVISPEILREENIGFTSAMIAGRTLTEGKYVLKHLDDRAWVGRNSSGVLTAIVCDGVGSTHGEIMANALVEGVRNSQGKPPESLINGARRGHLNGKKDSRRGVSASTITALQIDKDTVHYIHLGDSRFYILRGGKLYQMTEDHNEYTERVQRLIERRNMTREQAQVQVAKEGTSKNTLTRSAGSDEDYLAPLDVGRRKIEKGDILLLASDGIEKYIEDKHLKTALEAVLKKSGQDPAKLLTEMALQRAMAMKKKQIDDISAVVIKIA